MDAEALRFREETKKLLDEIAKDDPERLKSLHEAAEEMRKTMEEDPTLFQKTLEEFARSKACDDEKSIEPPTNAALEDKAGTGEMKDIKEKQASTSSSSSSSTAKASQPKAVPTPDVTAVPQSKSCEPEGGEGFGKLKQPDAATVFAKWAFQADDKQDGKPIYINVCQSDEIPEMNPNTGYVPTFVSPIVRRHVDLVVNPEVLRRAHTDEAFKDDLIGMFAWHLHQTRDINLALPTPIFSRQLCIPPLLSILRGELGPIPEESCAPVQPTQPQQPSSPRHSAPPIDISVKWNEVSELVEVSAKVANVDCSSSCPAKATDFDLKLMSSISLRITYRGGVSDNEPSDNPTTGYVTDVVLPCAVKNTGYTAKFVKKTATLRVSLPPER